jgi:hypothetical protein
MTKTTKKCLARLTSAGGVTCSTFSVPDQLAVVLLLVGGFLFSTLSHALTRF